MFPTMMDKPWNKNMVARILEDDRYIGEKVIPALIPTEQFHAAQERRKRSAP
ncbi:MAG: recombinase family protein [Dysosmobacter sp.]